MDPWRVESMISPDFGFARGLVTLLNDITKIYLGVFKQSGSAEQATLIQEKDNPTGLLEHDDVLEVRVFFK